MKSQRLLRVAPTSRLLLLCVVLLLLLGSGAFPQCFGERGGADEDGVWGNSEPLAHPLAAAVILDGCRVIVRFVAVGTLILVAARGDEGGALCSDFLVLPNRRGPQHKALSISFSPLALSPL